MFNWVCDDFLCEVGVVGKWCYVGDREGLAFLFI